MNKRKTFTSLALVAIMAATMSTTAFAAETAPVINDTKDFSNVGEPTYNYEGDYIIQSYDLTDEEIKLGQDLQELHTHPTKARHFSLTPHSHSIKNVKTGTSRKYSWNPTTVWTRNSKYPKSTDWPTVSWATSKSKSVSKSVSTSVGVTDSVVSSSLGTSYTKSHTISTSTTRTFKVPYKKDGRVKVTYSRPYKTFTCVTTYVLSGPPLSKWQETGKGSALGKPTNIVCDLETRSY